MGATRSFRFREHTLRPDTDAPPLYAMECQSCGQHSEDSTNPADGSDWAAGHLKENPGHLAYQEHIERSYRFEPGEWL